MAPDWIGDAGQVLNEIEMWPGELWSSRDMQYWVERAVKAEAAVPEAKRQMHLAIVEYLAKYDWFDAADWLESNPL